MLKRPFQMFPHKYKLKEAVSQKKVIQCTKKKKILENVIGFQKKRWAFPDVFLIAKLKEKL